MQDAAYQPNVCSNNQWRMYPSERAFSAAGHGRWHMWLLFLTAAYAGQGLSGFDHSAGMQYMPCKYWAYAGAAHTAQLRQLVWITSTGQYSTVQCSAEQCSH